MTGAATSGSPQRQRRIGLFGQYSSRNLGDTAIIHEVVRNLSARIDGAVFVGICSDPEDAVRTHGIAAFPVSGHGPAIQANGTPWTEFEPMVGPGGGTRRINRLVRSLDLLVMSGGGQIDEHWGGPGNQPRFLAVWTLIARIRRVPTAYLCVGVDQLNTRTGRWLALLAACNASFLSFRDAGSRDYLVNLGLKKRSVVCADPAFGLVRLATPARCLRARVVLSPIAKRSWPGVSVKEYERYIAELARFAEEAVRSGLEVRLLCSQVSMDPGAVAELRSAMHVGARCSSSAIEATSFGQFLVEASSAAVVVTSRLHGAILSMVVGTPVVAVSVSRKVTTVMADMGLERLCVDAVSFDAARLMALATSAIGAGDPLRENVRRNADHAASALPGTYDSLADLLQRK